MGRLLEVLDRHRSRQLSCIVNIMAVIDDVWSQCIFSDDINLIGLECSGFSARRVKIFINSPYHT